MMPEGLTRLARQIYDARRSNASEIFLTQQKKDARRPYATYDARGPYVAKNGDAQRSCEAKISVP